MPITLYSVKGLWFSSVTVCHKFFLESCHADPTCGNLSYMDWVASSTLEVYWTPSRLYGCSVYSHGRGCGLCV